MANLSPAELLKYDWRVEIFLRKYKAQENFRLTTGKDVKIIYNDDKYRTIASRNQSDLKDLRFAGADGNVYSLSSFEKTSEFGGRGSGSSTVKEDKELKSLITQIDNLKSELGRATVPFKLNNVVYEVAGAETTPGTPKSDFHLFDIQGNEIVWISHKSGKYARDFQQWGGVSKSEPEIYNHKEVQSFAKDVIEMTEGVMPRATTLARKIKDKRLEMLAVYGRDYGKKFGQQNVTILIQGPVKVVKAGRFYKFDSNHIHFNGDKLRNSLEPVLMVYNFEPTLVATYKGDRDNFGVKGARFSISPRSSRKITKWI